MTRAVRLPHELCTMALALSRNLQSHTNFQCFPEWYQIPDLRDTTIHVCSNLKIFNLQVYSIFWCRRVSSVLCRLLASDFILKTVF